MTALRFEEIDWLHWQPDQEATLLFVVRNGKILLIDKKRGIGAGKINGPGGRVDPGESAVAAAIREVEEELGVTPTGVRSSGVVLFQVIDGPAIRIHVYRADDCIGDARETDEAAPRWTDIDDIPFGDMWEDDVLWFPHLLNGTPFEARTLFEGDRLIGHEIVRHQAGANEHSGQWFTVFHDTIASDVTEHELAFLERWLPRDEFPTVVDLCCGRGRHAVPLAQRGYRVTGVDRDGTALEAARRAGVPATFVQLDMRSVDRLDGPVDAVVNLWQSFGYFGDDEDRGVLRKIHDLLRPGGRLVVDVYNRHGVEGAAVCETSTRGGEEVRTTRTWTGNRLRVQIRYAASSRVDTFDWRIYTPDELEALAAAAGLEPVMRCAWFDDHAPPGSEHARMQLVFRRPERLTAPIP